jgi:hypothetical protein
LQSGGYFFAIFLNGEKCNFHPIFTINIYRGEFCKMAGHSLFSVGTKQISSAARRSIANDILLRSGHHPLTQNELRVFDFGIGCDRPFFDVSKEKAKVLLNHGLLCKGFSETPLSWKTYLPQYPAMDKSVFTEFSAEEGKVSYVNQSYGAPCVTQLVYSDGFSRCDAVLLRTPGHPDHLFHFSPGGLKDETETLLNSLPPGEFIGIFGSESLRFANKTFKEFGHKLSREISFPTGPYHWGMYYRPNINRIFLDQSITKTIFEFEGFPA